MKNSTSNSDTEESDESCESVDEIIDEFNYETAISTLELIIQQDTALQSTDGCEGSGWDCPGDEAETNQNIITQKRIIPTLGGGGSDGIIPIRGKGGHPCATTTIPNQIPKRDKQAKKRMQSLLAMIQVPPASPNTSDMRTGGSTPTRVNNVVASTAPHFARTSEKWPSSPSQYPSIHEQSFLTFWLAITSANPNVLQSASLFQLFIQWSINALMMSTLMFRMVSLITPCMSVTRSFVLIHLLIHPNTNSIGL